MLDIIYKRRSIRKYLDKPVPNEAIVEIIRAGMAAPSAHNQQPWRFLVMDQRELIDFIPTFHCNAPFFNNSPSVIMILADLSSLHEVSQWPHDCSACAENMMLAIEELGLGGVWLAIYPLEVRIEGFRKMFNLPEHIMPFSLISLGYKAMEKEPAKDRFHEDFIHWNKW